MRTGDLFGATGLAVRDTNPHDSSTARTSGERVTLLSFNSTLNQSASVQVKGSMDGQVWNNLGSALTVTSAAPAWQTVTDPWPYLKATVTCGTGPASGVLSGKYAAK